MSFLTETIFPTIRGWITGDKAPIVPVVPLRGVIGQVGIGRRGLTLDSVAPLLHRAFRIKRAEAVAIIINSPGGSPVQSSLIAQRIRQLADENEIKVLVFCEDVAASGGYWLAAAADEIFVDRSSIVGSIGVISSGFGFKDAIKKLGIRRRVHAAGDNKSFLDPFLPEKADDVARLRGIQDELHETFRDYVKERRGDRLADDPDLFTGAFWTGAKAVDLGLADEIGEARAVLRERYGERLMTPVIKAKRGLFGSRFGGAEAQSDVWIDGALASVEERLIWERFRL